ncbi:MAG: hypothetical protein ACLPR9_03895 [Acidimicrobiales bacterium]
MSIQNPIRCNDGIVGTGKSEDKESLVRPEVEVWLTGAMPSITELMAAAKRVMGVVALGPEATQAAADHLEVAAFHAREWHSGHPCPDPAIGEQVAAAFDAFTALADDCAVAAKSIPGYSSHALDERAGEAVAGLMTVMYATRSAER